MMDGETRAGHRTAATRKQEWDGKTRMEMMTFMIGINEERVRKKREDR